MEKVWCVESGEYSDYGIDAIFSTQELAEKFIAAFAEDRYHQMRICERTLNPAKSYLLEDRKAYFLRINKEGNTIDLEHRGASWGFTMEDSEADFSYTHNNEWLNCYCLAKDEAHAIKIANEKRQKIIALNQWGVFDALTEHIIK